MLAAERAILTHFKTVGGIFLVLESIVVPLLAFVASHSNFYSHIGTSLYYLAFSHVASLIGTDILSRQKSAHKNRTSPPTGNVYFSIVFSHGQQLYYHFYYKL